MKNIMVGLFLIMSLINISSATEGCMEKLISTTKTFDFAETVFDKAISSQEKALSEKRTGNLKVALLYSNLAVNYINMTERNLLVVVESSDDMSFECLSPEDDIAKILFKIAKREINRMENLSKSIYELNSTLP